MSIAVPNVFDPSCWIAPDGKVTFVHDYDGSHCRAAVDALDDDTGGAMLERQGYLHVSGGSVYTGYDAESIPPTQAQIDSLFDIVMVLKSSDRHDSYYVNRYEAFISKHQEVRS